MPNGFDNPYLTQDDPYYIEPHQSSGGQWTELADFYLPSYQYQGMGTDIMSALSNVFNPGGGDAYNLQNILFGSDIPMDLFSPTITFGDEGANVEGSWNFGGLGGSFNESLEGPEGFLGLTNIFDPESLAATLSSLGGMEEAIRPGEIKALTPEMLEKTESAYYDPYESTQRQSLVEKLGKARGGVSTGGFAGSGARQSGLSGAERLYRGGYEDILGDIMKMRGCATEDVMDTIYGWEELIG